jgi:hypothetical protein
VSAHASDAVRVLRAEGRYAVGLERVPWARLALWVAAGGGLYGFAMGSLEARWVGALYAALKVPLLLTLSVAICLPSSWVLHLLLGLGRDFRAAARGILSAQGTLALCLAALSPVIALVYVSGPSYPAALLANAALFGLAASGAQLTLARHYRPLIAREPRHRRALAAWFALYSFVAIKLGYVLRPFVGDPRLPTTFLREEQWQENPYASLFWTAVGLVASILRR